MREVEGYLTLDGKFFNKETDAAKYEESLMYDEVGPMIDKGLNIDKMRSPIGIKLEVADFIVNNRRALYSLHNKYSCT